MLKDIIKYKGLKQRYLADKIGVSVVTMSNWANGKSSPSKENLKKLCDILDVSQQDILG